MAKQALIQTQYHVNEDPYCYCPTCNAVHRSLSLVGTRCNRSDLSPFVGKYCTGVLLKGAPPQQFVTSPDQTKSS